MLEPGGELDLAEEAIGAQHGRELGVEDLQGDQTVMLDVPGQVHRRHAAAAELPLEDIAVAEGVFEYGVAADQGITLVSRRLAAFHTRYTGTPSSVIPIPASVVTGRATSALPTTQRVPPMKMIGTAG